VTVPHPLLGRSPSLNDSGEHSDADIVYVAGYEWALSTHQDAIRSGRDFESPQRAEWQPPWAGTDHGPGLGEPESRMTWGYLLTCANAGVPLPDQRRYPRFRDT